jgi:hypothetical protein
MQQTLQDVPPWKVERIKCPECPRVFCRRRETQIYCCAQCRWRAYCRRAYPNGRRPDCRKNPSQKWSAKERRKAQAAVNAAVKDGRLTRPEFCDECGAWPDIMPNGFQSWVMNGHHHKGYDPEHWLDVVWLCPACHKATDLEQNALAHAKLAGGDI